MGRWRDDYDNWGYYEPSRPIRVQGGIKTKKEYGQIGETWWSKRWIAVLESFNMGTRLTRGRSYARQGQVISLDGEMPKNIEEAFGAVKLSLFPTALKELETSCSCPDWANPCKHIAAVYYLLAERFDEDPFLIFKLRGRTKEQIIEVLRHKRAETLAAESSSLSAGGDGLIEADTALPLLEENLDAFWQAGEALDTFTVKPGAPEVDKAILKRLGEAPFAVGNQNIAALLAKVYDAVDAAVRKEAEE